MKINLVVSAVACLSAFPIIASAGMAYIPYGVALPVGERMISDFSTSAGLSAPDLATGSVADITAAPAYGPSTVDTAQYLSIPGGGSSTLTFSPTREVSVYIGSLDAYNTLSFGGLGGQAYTGSVLGAASGGSNGDRGAANTNGRFVFTFANPVDSVTFSSGGNAFEVANVAGAAPEPGTWALMLIGLAGMGGALRARTRFMRPASLGCSGA